MCEEKQVGDREREWDPRILAVYARDTQAFGTGETELLDGAVLAEEVVVVVYRQRSSGSYTGGLVSPDTVEAKLDFVIAAAKPLARLAEVAAKVVRDVGEDPSDIEEALAEFRAALTNKEEGQ